MIEKEYEIDEFIGYKLREQRQKLNFTLSDISSRVGVSLQQIQKYEQGKSRIPAVLLFKISKILNVTPDYFFEGVENISSNFFTYKTKEDISFERPKSLNLFIIEDDPSDELLIRNILNTSRYDIKIHSAHDGEKALEMLRNRESLSLFPRPDLIFLDLNIPKRDGHYVLKEIKRDENLCDIPVVVITNSISAKDMMSTYKGYAAGYIFKSFDIEVFHKDIIRTIEYWADVAVLPRMGTG
ncbi:MAG: response regulator [Alphaproteobacteria bacterium]|nr:MAG: response regulator [Alphaproteobacteria bacterium]